MRDPSQIRPLYAPWRPSPVCCPFCGATLYSWTNPRHGIKLRLVCSQIECTYYREKFSDGTINKQLPAEIRTLDTQGSGYDPIQARKAFSAHQSARANRKGGHRRRAFLHR